MKKNNLTPAAFATEAEFAHALKALSRQCHVMDAVYRHSGPPPLRDFTGDFEGLVRIVVGQQVSAASAAAIWRRVRAGIAPFVPETIHMTSDADLQALGLSRPKIKTLRALSTATTGGAIKFAHLSTLDDDAIRACLTAVSGIGPWTADIFLLFALRRADAFPSGDLALQLSAENLFGLADRPNARKLLDLAERWRPWRGAAAHLMWAHYASMKSSTLPKT